MIPKNKLWALPSNEKTAALQSKYEHFYANNDHCLIISPEQPPMSMELTAGMQKLLTARDWEWLYGESEKIREQEAVKYASELEQFARDFSERFLSELSKMKGSDTADGQSNTDSTTASPE